MSMDRKIKNAKKVQDHVDKTPLEDIEVNGDGEVNWKVFCETVGISRSSDQTNDLIAKIKEDLNERLAENPRFTNKKKKASNDEVKLLERRISLLENKVAELSAENQLLKSQAKGLDFFLDNRRMVRQ